VLVPTLHLVRDPPRLVALVEALDAGDLLAPRPVRAKRLPLSVSILGDHRIRGIQDHGAGPVVLLEPDHPGTLEGRLEAEDVPDVRTSPPVDGLVVVPDHHEVRMTLGKQLQEAELRVIGVLVLVDQDEGEAVPIARENLGMRLKQLDRFDEQVVEVEGVL